MIRSVALGVSSSIVFASVAAAQPLNLTPSTPDVASGFVSITYNAGTSVFTASGFTQNVNQPPMVPAGQRAFSLTARISNAGVVIPGGASLSVRGDIGGTDQLLFSSTNLTNFGFGITDEFEFIFVQQAGSLAAVGQPIGTILVGPGLFNGNGGLPRFTTSFSLTASGNADTFPVPAPGAAMALGVGGLAVLRRRSR